MTKLPLQFNMLRFAASQYWEERKKTLLASSRLRTYLLRRDVARDFKDQIWDVAGRVRLDKPRKPEGATFVESLPILAEASVRAEARRT